jgi:hypothetical protein
MVTNQLLLAVSAPFTCINIPRNSIVYMHTHIGYRMQAEQVKDTNCKTSNAVQHVSNVAWSIASTAQVAYT